MAVANNTLIFFATLLALWGVCCGAVYKVGDSNGWTSLGSVDYKHWASTKRFHVGDILVFEYNTEYHNVMQVTHKDFRSCNATSPIVTYHSGSDSITVTRPGHLFFICGSPGHCQAGQKVDIGVALNLHAPDYDEELLRSPAPAPAPTTDPTSGSSSALYSSNIWSLTTTAALVASFFCFGGFF